VNARITALRSALDAIKAAATDTDEDRAILALAKVEFAREVVEVYASTAPEPREIDDRVRKVASVLPLLSSLERDLVVIRLAKAWGLPKPALRAKLTAPKAAVEQVDPTEEAEPFAEAPEWLKSLQVRKDGRLYANYHNLETILRNDEEAPQVHWDVLEQTIAWSSPPAWAGQYQACAKNVESLGVLWSNEDSTRLSAWFSREFKLDAPIKDLERAIEVVAHEREVDSWRDHLDTLVWDGVPRLATAAETYYRATNGQAANLGYYYWVQQIAARAYQPGCKADLVLVLHGGQGTYKSTSLRLLCGSKLFSDCELDLESKEVASNLAGKIIHEFGEGTILTRKDVNTIKAFVTRQSERFTPKFKSKAIEVPRRSSFSLTTNDDEALQDPTGLRRFPVVEVGEIDIVSLERDAQQLLAEAVALYKSGSKWYPQTDEEKALLASGSDALRKRSPWEAELETGLTNQNEVTVERALEIVGFSTKDVQQRHRLEAIGCLRSLGWIRSAGQKRIEGRLTRYYERKTPIEVKLPKPEITTEDLEKDFGALGVATPANEVFSVPEEPPPSGVVEAPVETIVLYNAAIRVGTPDPDDDRPDFGRVSGVGPDGINVCYQFAEGVLETLSARPPGEGKALPVGKVAVEVRSRVAVALRKAG
jgi:predicted P-loop ATPase